MSKGTFIVIEGVDGAGTTTQVSQLTAALRARGRTVRETREPSTGPIGALLRQCLTGRIVTPSAHGPRAPGWQTMALLFAADRVDHIEAEVAPLLEQGVTVISDRYYHSSVAYQALTAGADVETDGAIAWIRTLNAHARKPDLTIVIDVAAEQAGARRNQRGGSAELYEQDQLQARLVAFYAQLEQHFPGEPIVHLSGAGSIEHVAAAVLAAVDAHVT